MRFVLPRRRPRYQFVISGGDRDPYRPPPRSPANMTFSSDTCLPFSETPDQPGDYSGDTR